MQINNFNKKAVEALRSPDDLEKTIRIPSPGVWLILLACIALMLGLLSWGIFGTVSPGIEVTGVYRNGKIISLIDSDRSDEVQVGDTAQAGDTTVTVEYISEIPLSRSEAEGVLGSEYLVNTNIDGEWGMLMTLTPGNSSNLEDGKMLTFHLSAKLKSPISYILGGKI